MRPALVVAATVGKKTNRHTPVFIVPSQRVLFLPRGKKANLIEEEILHSGF